MSTGTQGKKTIYLWLELFLYTFLVVSIGTVVLGCNFKHKIATRNNGVKILATHTAFKKSRLTRIQGIGAGGNFCSMQLIAIDKNPPIGSEVQSGDWPKVLYRWPKTQTLCRGVERLTELRESFGIFPCIDKINLARSYIRSVSKLAGEFINPIRFLHSLPLEIKEDAIDNQGDECKESDASTNPRDDVKSFRCIKLILSITFLVGISLFVVGVRLNSYGIDHGRFTYRMTGWWTLVFGTMLVLLPLLMFFTQWVYSRLDNTSDGPKRHVTVLHIGPTTSAVEAVRAAVVQEFRSLESSQEN
jgi:hypothetical protein